MIQGEASSGTDQKQQSGDRGQPRQMGGSSGEDQQRRDDRGRSHQNGGSSG
jgi:hypothetical protein